MGDTGVVLVGDDGALARRVARLLQARGVGVSIVVADEEEAATVARSGARPLIAVVDDAAALTRALRGHDAVIRLPAPLPSLVDSPSATSWAAVAQWRTETAEIVARACDDASVRVHVAESTTDLYAGGDGVLDETSTTETAGSAVLEDALQGERHARSVSGRAVVLRLGELYGRDVARSVELVSLLQHRRYTLVGPGREYRPVLHIDDAAAAFVTALTLPAGTYNVVDATPTTLRAQLAALAAAVDAPPLRRRPRFLGRALRGETWTWSGRSQRVTARRLGEAGGWEPATPDATVGWPQVVDDWRTETGRDL